MWSILTTNHDTAGVQNRVFLHYKNASSYGGKKQNEKVLLAAIPEDYAPKGNHIFQYEKWRILPRPKNISNVFITIVQIQKQKECYKAVLSGRETIKATYVI